MLRETPTMIVVVLITTSYYYISLLTPVLSGPLPIFIVDLFWPLKWVGINKLALCSNADLQKITKQLPVEFPNSLR